LFSGYPELIPDLEYGIEMTLFLILNILDINLAEVSEISISITHVSEQLMNI